MGLKVGELTAYLDLDDAKYNSKLDGAETKATGMGSQLGKVAGAIGGAAITGKVVGFFKDATDGASDLAESTSKVGVVFGDQAGVVEAFASTSATSMGISEQAALEATGTFGNLFTALKIGQEPAAGMSTSLVALAGDLASFNNVSPEEALIALRSGLVGETEPLKRFGVNMNEATLKAKAMELGISDGTGVLDPAVKAQAAYALILEQTTTAQGDFARTSDGLANSQRIASAQWKDISATLGTALLPVVTSVVGGFSSLLSAFTSLPGPVQQVIGVVAGIAAALAGIALVAGPLIGGFTAIAGILPVLGGAFTALTGPIGLIVLAIASVIAIGVLLYKHWDEVSAFMGKVWEGIKSTAETVWGAIKDFFVKYWPILLIIFTGGIAAIPVLIAKNWDAIKTKTSEVWDAIKMFLSGVWDTIKSTAGTVFAAMKAAVVTIWEGIKSAVVSVVNGLKSAVTTGFENLVGNVKAVLSVIESVVMLPFDAARIAVKLVIDTMKSVLKGDFEAIPGLIKSALGDLGSLLYGAGKAVMTGLLNGIKAAWTATKDFLSGLGQKIKDLKGPIGKDRTLLYNEGAAIIAGLGKGMQSQIPGVLKIASGLTGDLSMSGRTGAIGSGSTTNNNQRAITINVSGNDGVTIGQQIAVALAGI